MKKIQIHAYEDASPIVAYHQYVDKKNREGEASS